MKTYLEFISEVKTATTISKKSRGFINSVLPNSGKPMSPKLIQNSGGHYIGAVTHAAGTHHIYKFPVEGVQNSVTFSAHDPETGRSTLAVQGHHGNGVLSKLNLAAAKDNTFPAHEFYHHLLKKGHVKALVADHQSAGGKRVWEKLSKKRGVGIHGWDPKKEVPLNVKFGEDETHEERPNGIERNTKEYKALNPDSDVPKMQLVAHIK